MDPNGARSARAVAFPADPERPAVLVAYGITSRMLRCHPQGPDPDAFETVGAGRGVVHALPGGMQTLLTEEA